MQETGQESTYADELIQNNVAEVRARRDVEREDSTRPASCIHQRVIASRGLKGIDGDLEIETSTMFCPSG